MPRASVKAGDVEATKKIVQYMQDTVSELGNVAPTVGTYKPGEWEEGLPIASKAAVWLQADAPEALRHVWNV